MTTLVIILVVGWIGVCALFYLFQDRLLFIPRRALIMEPGSVGLVHDDLELSLPGGGVLHGWYVHAPGSRGTLLFCHGNAGNISHRLDSIREFVRHRLDVLIFDYEGYGRSSGSPGEDELYRDVQIAWDYLTATRGIPEDRIVLFGRSLGGAVAAWMAGRVNAAGLIVESCFTSVPDMARELYPFFTLRSLVRHKLDAREHIRAARCKVLVAHSKDDEIVPYAHGRRMYEAAPDPKWFLEMRGGHNYGPERTGEAYTQGLGEFFDRVLPVQ
ncbi:MAG: alpha/beta hydrolase [Planctomycetota bacterium]